MGLEVGKPCLTGALFCKIIKSCHSSGEKRKSTLCRRVRSIFLSFGSICLKKLLVQYWVVYRGLELRSGLVCQLKLCNNQRPYLPVLLPGGRAKLVKVAMPLFAIAIYRRMRYPLPEVQNQTWGWAGAIHLVPARNKRESDHQVRRGACFRTTSG